MTGRRIAYGLILTASAAFWIYYDGAVSVWLFAAALGLPLLSLLASLPFVRKAEAEIESPHTVRRGSSCSLFFRIRTKKGRSPLPGSIKATLRDLMEERADRLSFEAPADGVVFFQALHSGVWQAEIKKAYLCDFLGLIRFPASLPPPSRLSVPPVPEEPSPAPDYGMFRTSSVRPKPGGGFSEIHELREYRAGDPMRSVHWKATAKTDRPMVREPQETLSRRTLLICSLPALSEGRDAADRVLDRLTWVSGELLGMDVPHAVFSPADGSLRTVFVREDLAALTEELMSSPLSRKKGEDCAPPSADWVFRIGAENGREAGS